MENNFKRNIVVSGINLVNSGSFEILRECLGYLSENLSDSYNVIALVHKKVLLKIDNITYYEFSDSKTSWGRRLYYEYVYFKRLSKKLRPYLWLSLHDMTPNVQSEILAVYCHNPAPFYKLSCKELIVSPKFTLFNLFYKYLYMINIRKNDFVIVQQDWLRNEFRKMFNISNIIVAHPESSDNFDVTSQTESDLYTFIYPAFPRIFKNFEVVCSAAEQLYLKGISDFRIILTIDGSESRYSRFIYNKFKHVPVLSFNGFRSRNEILEYYNISDCLVFPSKLETWGLPITEFKKYNKPILLANLPYVHETVGEYSKVKFFSPNNVGELASAMEALMRGDIMFDATNTAYIKPPYAENWQQLFDILLSRKPTTVFTTSKETITP